MRYPEMTFRGRITYSRTAVEVERAAMQLLKTIEAKKSEGSQAAIGFDIEWRASFRKGASPGKAAVMQICVDTGHCHVMHIIHSGIPKSLQLLLENSMLLKVGIGICNDAVKVFKDYNVSVKAVEDLSYLANQKLGGDSQKYWSLASLTENLISKQLPKPKRIQLGNWEADVLTKDQLQYAATDAFVSRYLYEVLRSLPDVEKVATNKTSEEVKDALPSGQSEHALDARTRDQAVK
ncbi:Werner Syndrome-like exonuclease [Morus notabilis]|uniref:3'-5' exonuclease n=2 Tax=Morus notabilis TaxID=981085 RepID=W9R0L0_9ROSA|nr:Werner Syndrome-like exonuclease [Morus notabilis]